MNKFNKIIYSLLTVLIFVFATFESKAQQFNIFGIDTTQFPTVKASFYARTEGGSDYTNMQVSEFNLWENGVSMNPSLSIDCKRDSGYVPVAVHFMIDVSSTMDLDAGNGEKRVIWERQGVQAFLDSIHLTAPSQLAVLTFAGKAINNSGWMLDKDAMSKWVTTNVNVYGGTTDFGPPYLQTSAITKGSLVNMAGVNPMLRRVTIFLSDGKPERTFGTNVIDSILRIAKREKVQCYAVFITSSADPDIDYICRATGGKTFQAFTKDDMMDAFRKIVGDIQNKNICQLVWTSPYGCDEASRNRDVKAVFTRIPDSVNVKYLAPTSSLSNLKLSVTDLLFGAPGTGVITQDIILTSGSTPVNVTGFTLAPANNKYTIDWNGKTLPFTLPKNSTHTIKVNYIESPVTASELTVLQILSDPCNPPTVNLVAPCGGTFEQKIDFGDVALNTNSDKTYSCIFKNTTAATISGNAQITGPNTTEFELLVGKGPFTLTPGQCLNVTVSFKPTGIAGARNANIEYNIPNVCGTPKTQLTGNGIQSDFPLSTLNFGEKRVKTDNADVYKITNNGNTPVKILTFTQRVKDGNFIITLPTAPVDIAVGASISIPVRFIPQAEGYIDDFIDITIENIPGKLTGEVQGIGILPKITANAVVFPATKILSKSAVVNLVINNPSSSANLSVKDVSLADNSEFKFETGAVLTNFVVNKNNGTATIPMSFTPSVSGLRQTTVIIKCDAGTGTTPDISVNVNISGTGLGLDLTGDYDFGDVLSCVSKENTYTINNTTGSTPLDVNSLMITGSTMFTVSQMPPASIPAGSNGTFKIKFSPTANGIANANIDLKTSNGNDVIPIKGNGIFKTITPKIQDVLPGVKVQPNQMFPLIVNSSIPDLQGLQISAFSYTVKYYGKSFSYDKLGNNITSTLPGWTWNIININDNTIEFDGQGPAITKATDFKTTIMLKTYLADLSTTDIIVTAKVNNNSNACIQGLSDTTTVLINTCFTEGSLIIANSSGYSLSQVEPNPASTEIKLQAGIGLDGNTKIEIFNSVGSATGVVYNQNLKSGNYEINIPVAELPNGVYMLRMESGPFVQVRKVIVTK